MKFPALTGLLGLFLFTASARSQDTVFPAFGNLASGTPFDVRATGDAQPRRLLVKHDPTLVRGLQIEWCGRDMTTATGLSTQLGLNFSQQAVITTAVNLAPGEYIRRVDVWAISSFVTQLRIYTPSTSYNFGAAQTGDTRRNFVAPVGQQVVGFVGTTTSSMLNSLGVVTRPLLASDQRFGTGCPTALGNLALRWRYSWNGMSTAQLPVIECPNVPALSTGIFVYGFSDQTHAGVPLPYNLAPQGSPTCNIYTSLDFHVLSFPEPNGVIAHTIGATTWTGFVGLKLFLQAVILQPNGSVKASDALKTVIGVL
ncbi:MAG: hypothetical protein JNK49_09830 [Planctomycetes bacterium]|nr:hypothetical protein [Planctomycetota bacterium]